MATSPTAPQPPEPPRSSHWVAIALLSLALIIVVSGITILLGLRFLSHNLNLSVHETGKGVDIKTPVGSFDVRKEVSEAQLGLPIYPGSERLHNYPNIQRSATLWYHDHAMHDTARNVYMGLAGFYLITDDHEQSLPLPKGQFDIPLVVQDRLFTPTGSLFLPQHDPTRPERQGVFGDVILVNGAPYPVLPVARRKYRFRVLNGSDARAYQWRLSTGDPFQVIASDGGLLPTPVATPDLFHMPSAMTSWSTSPSIR